MRDGVVLRADVYRPDDDERHPVLLERVAYELTNRAGAYGEFYGRRGYAVVAQNVRGAYASEGRYRFCHDDVDDGYDTVEWAAAQPWSNGRVGMIDGSYSGFTQYTVAPARPPHLAALYVREGGGDLYQDAFFPG